MSAEVTDALVEALEAHGARVDRTGGRFSVRMRDGLRAPVAELDPAGVTAIATRDLDNARTGVASFARGVVAVLAKPTADAGEDIEFAEAAASLLPTIEGPAFAAGVAAAGAGAPFLLPLADSLGVAFEIELDDGVHVVSDEQVRRWGCTDDRIVKAAISILYHRSWGLDFAETSAAGVRRFDGRDGRDAPRVLMLEQWDHVLSRTCPLVAVPSADHLLVSESSDAPVASALAAEARRAFDEAASPLSPRVFRFRSGRLESV